MRSNYIDEAYVKGGKMAIVLNNIVTFRRFRQLKTITFDSTESRLLNQVIL